MVTNEEELTMIPEATMDGEALENFVTTEETEALDQENGIAVSTVKKRKYVTALQYYCYQLQQRKSKKH